jgi:hypothetical protein
LVEIERDDAGDWTDVASALRQWGGRRVEVDVMGLGTTAAIPSVVAELRGQLRIASDADDPMVARFEVGDGAFAVTHEMAAAEWLDRERLQLQIRQSGVAVIIDARQQ